MGAPVIGVVPLVDIERESYWMLPGYMDGIAEAGGLPIMLPLVGEEKSILQMADFCDGFLFTGGQDVEPSLYGEEREENCGDPCPGRDEMESRLLGEIMRRDKPLLGICRGIQLLNVALGGSLYQHLPEDRPSGVEHRMSPPYDRAVHNVDIVSDTPLHELLKKDSLAVNSYHHQGVKELARPLRVMAVAEDGLIEGAYLPGMRFIWAVQWHPEFSHRTSEDSRKIFSAFLQACAR